MSGETRYTSVAILLHWLIAVGILILCVIGLIMVHATLAPMMLFKLFQLHKSVGITVLALGVFRLLWRLGHRPPPLPAHMPPHEKLAAEGAHWVLYALMLGLPLTGWAYVSVAPINLPTVLYGLIPVPHLSFLADWFDKKALAPVVEAIHAYGAWFLIAVIGVHALAALRHHFVSRDDILWRMLPFISRPGSDKSVNPRPASRKTS